MAAGITERNQHCWRCATVNPAGDKFCQGCGASLVRRDNTTRYLCAAAQLSEVYANTAIREFLVEPLRAIPPAPGVDTTAVLREAVAARARRRIRDGVLLILLPRCCSSTPWCSCRGWCSPCCWPLCRGGSRWPPRRGHHRRRGGRRRRVLVRSCWRWASSASPRSSAPRCLRSDSGGGYYESPPPSYSSSAGELGLRVAVRSTLILTGLLLLAFVAVVAWTSSRCTIWCSTGSAAPTSCPTAGPARTSGSAGCAASGCRRSTCRCNGSPPPPSRPITADAADVVVHRGFLAVHRRRRAGARAGDRPAARTVRRGRGSRNAISVVGPARPRRRGDRPAAHHVDARPRPPPGGPGAPRAGARFPPTGW